MSLDVLMDTFVVLFMVWVHILQTTLSKLCLLLLFRAGVQSEFLLPFSIVVIAICEPHELVLPDAQLLLITSTLLGLFAVHILTQMYCLNSIALRCFEKIMVSLVK